MPKEAKTIIYHVPKYSLYPDGEPKSVREAADKKQKEKKEGKKNG